MPPKPDEQKKRVFIVDDHSLVREWLAYLINQQADLQVCGEAGNAAQTLSFLAKAKPDVAVVDISLEGESGLDLIKNIKAAYPNVAVLVLSMHDELVYAEKALRAGAQGYIMKREVTRKVLQGIRSVFDGKLYLSEKITNLFAQKMVEGQPSATASPAEMLSNRELEVFKFLGQGRANRQIAEELRISLKTVQTYCARIKIALRLRTHTELLREAIRWNDRMNLS